MSDKILVSRKFGESVLILTLNAPKANVLDSEMMAGISAALEAAEGERGLKLVHFRAEGPNFSFGASVEEHRKEKAAAMLRQFHGIFERLVRLGVPSLAAVQGRCLGGGMELAAFCNFVIASQDAKFGQPEIKLGVFPPPASVFLPLKVGQAAADDLVLTGRTVTAEECLRMGFVTAAAPAGENLDAFIEKWTKEHIVPKSASSLRIANAVCRREFNEKFLEGLKAAERIYVERLMETRDANEGINSFLEKREPVWKNE